MHKSRLLKKICLTFVVIFLSISIFSSQVFTPPKNLYQMETTHYKFVFEKDLYYFYEDIVGYAEQIYVTYKYFFGADPGKITVYIR